MGREWCCRGATHNTEPMESVVAMRGRRSWRQPEPGVSRNHDLCDRAAVRAEETGGGRGSAHLKQKCEDDRDVLRRAGGRNTGAMEAGGRVEKVAGEGLAGEVEEAREGMAGESVVEGGLARRRGAVGVFCCV